MYYYDIHTHKQNVNENEIVIKSISYCDFKKDIIFRDNVFFSIGIHPWDTENNSEIVIDYSLFEDLLKNNTKIVAIGECGLDKLRGDRLQTQIDIFEYQVYLSEKYKKPLIIHCVKSWEEIVKVSKKTKPSQPWIIHGFRGNKELATQLIKLGFYLSFGEKFNIEAISATPRNKLFLETDVSHLSIYDIYQNIYESMSIEKEKLQLQICKNTTIFNF